MRTRRILIPIIEFGRAGGYRVLSELATRWTELGCVVDFLVHKGTSRPYFPTLGGIRAVDEHGHVAPLRPQDDQHHVHPSMRAPGIYWSLLRGLQAIGSEYDLILANHSMTAIPVWLARCGDARKIYYVQAYEPEYYAARKGWKALILQALSTLSYELPLCQIVNAPIYLGYKRIRAQSWIAPGIDQKLYFRREQPPQFRDGCNWTIGTIGRSEPDKGTVFVLKAFERLAESDGEVRLKVAFGLPKGQWNHPRAQVVVPSNDAELAEYYRSVDVLVAVPTQQFGACHYPVLEAMACGTPVISTGHLPADRTNAWIVPPGDADAIAGALEEIRRTPPAGVAAKLDLAARATSAFWWDEVARNFLRAIEPDRA